MILPIKVHMGQSLELLIRKSELNLSELAIEVGVDRRTLYNWFKREVLKESTINRITRIVNNEGRVKSNFKRTIEVNYPALPFVKENGKNEYWKDKYLDLLERYSMLLKIENQL